MIKDNDQEPNEIIEKFTVGGNVANQNSGSKIDEE